MIGFHNPWHPAFLTVLSSTLFACCFAGWAGRFSDWSTSLHGSLDYFMTQIRTHPELKLQNFQWETLAFRGQRTSLSHAHLHDVACSKQTALHIDNLQIGLCEFPLCLETLHGWPLMLSFCVITSLWTPFEEFSMVQGPHFKVLLLAPRIQNRQTKMFLRPWVLEWLQLSRVIWHGP